MADDGDGGWWEDPEGLELPEPYKSIGACAPRASSTRLGIAVAHTVCLHCVEFVCDDGLACGGWAGQCVTTGGNVQGTLVHFHTMPAFTTSLHRPHCTAPCTPPTTHCTPRPQPTVCPKMTCCGTYSTGRGT